MQRAHRLTTFVILGLFSFVAQPAAAQSVASAEMDFDAGVQEALIPQPYSGPHIVINVAARKLRLYDAKDALIAAYDIAVGSPGHKTPLGERSMTQVVWNPWWIPPKNSAWAKGAHDTPPGPHNPLGPVKMKLGDAIMVHGTNKDDSVGHAASHGCMRMHNEQAKELARYVQEQIMGNTEQSLYDQYAKEKSRSFYVNLTQSVPINIVYEVAEVDNGQLLVHPDIYWRVRDKVQAVTDVLSANGVDVAGLDRKMIEEQIRGARNQDMQIDVKEFVAAAKGGKIKTAKVD